MRIETKLAAKREAYAYKRFGLKTPKTVAEVKAEIDGDPAFGGTSISLQTLYRVRKLALANKPLPAKKVKGEVVGTEIAA